MTGTALAVTTEQRVSAAVQIVVAAIAVATTVMAAVSKATRKATIGSAAEVTWAATATASKTVTRKWLTVTEMDSAKPGTAAPAMEEVVATAGVAAKMVSIMTTSFVMARKVAAEAVEAVAITTDAEQVAVTWIMVVTIATVEASGMETSTSIRPAVAVQMVPAVAVRTATAEDVVIWVACYGMATSGVQSMVPRTTLARTLGVTALATAIVVPVMATECRKLTADAEAEAEMWILVMAGALAAAMTTTVGASMH
jgi:hypothetical protein